jgi:hypothetical protein
MDYGKLYYDYLTHDKSINLNTQISENIDEISHKSQMVYSAIPARFGYDNSDKICKQLCVLSTELFLESSSFLEYLKSFSGALKNLTLNKNKIFYDLRSGIGNPMLEKYYLNSEFIKGDTFSKEIMISAMSLPNMQKMSFLFAIGGHSINVGISNKDNKLSITYYEPYSGQVIIQTVTKAEIKSALENKSSFIHPKSILNVNNALLGELSIFEDSLPDTKCSYILKTTVTKTANNEASNQLSISSNIVLDDLLKYIATTPSLLDVAYYITQKDHFKKFLTQYKNKILDEIKNVEKCTQEMSKCSDYLYSIIKGFFPQTFTDPLGIKFDISTLYANKNSKYEHKILPSKFKESAEICIKEIKLNNDQPKAVKDFYKILFEDKQALNKAMNQCLTESSIVSKKKIAEKVCTDFSTVDAHAFENAHKAYYDHIDARFSTNNEKCLNLDVINQKLEYLGEAHHEL